MLRGRRWPRMVNFRLIITAVIALVSIAVPAYGTALLFGPELAAIVAVCIALGIGGGRWVAASQSDGSTGGNPNRGRRRQSKGAQGRDR